MWWQSLPLKWRKIIRAKQNTVSWHLGTYSALLFNILRIHRRISARFPAPCDVGEGRKSHNLVCYLSVLHEVSYLAPCSIYYLSPLRLRTARHPLSDTNFIPPDMTCPHQHCDIAKEKGAHNQSAAVSRSAFPTKKRDARKGVWRNGGFVGGLLPGLAPPHRVAADHRLARVQWVWNISKNMVFFSGAAPVA